MLGRLLRFIVIFPIPPSQAAAATATLLVTVAVIALAKVHTFPGVVAAAVGATAAVAAVSMLRNRRRAA